MRANKVPLAQSTLGANALARLESLIDGDNEFLRRRLRDDAEKAMQADPHEAHTILGLLAGLEVHVEDMRHHLEIAAQLSHSDMVEWLNRATAELWCGQFEQAAHYSILAMKQAPHDKDVQKAVTTMHIFHGDIPGLKILFDSLGVSTPETEMFKQVSAVMERYNLKRDDLIRHFNKAGEIAAKHHTPIMGVQLDVSDDAIMADFFVRADYADTSRMTNELKDFALNEESDAALAIINGFLPGSDYRERRAG